VNSFAELSFAPANPLKLVESRVLGILSDDFLITLSTAESSSCQRVAQEIKQQSAECRKIDSSNHLFSRLLGSSLHLNEDAAFVLEESAERFSECAAVDGPTPARRAQYAILKRSIIDAARALQNNPEVIHSLKEDRNLFGSEKPRAALERYQVIQASSESRLRQAEQFLTLSRDDWRLTQDEHRNGILFRLAILGGALSPTALATSLFSMNFPDGLPYSTTTMALGLGVSAMISTVLVGALMFKRAFPLHGRTMLKPSKHDIQGL
jgi:Mg2+ and Co2+ transporter CorA